MSLFEFPFTDWNFSSIEVVNIQSHYSQLIGLAMYNSTNWTTFESTILVIRIDILDALPILATSKKPEYCSSQVMFGQSHMNLSLDVLGQNDHWVIFCPYKNDLQFVNLNYVLHMMILNINVLGS